MNHYQPWSGQKRLTVSNLSSQNFDPSNTNIQTKNKFSILERMEIDEPLSIKDKPQKTHNLQ